MAKVLLKRNFNTPFGRFRMSRDGIPTEIPDIVLQRMEKRVTAQMTKEEIAELTNRLRPGSRLGLPVDATIVGDDYKTPQEQRIEQDVDSVPLTNAEIQAKIDEEVNKRVEAMANQQKAQRDEGIADKAAKLAQKEADAEEPEDEPEDVGDVLDQPVDVLDQPVDAIVPLLEGMDYDELKDLLEREQGGKTRKTLVVEIEAALAEFE